MRERAPASVALDNEIAAKESELAALHERRSQEQLSFERAKPLFDRLVFAATARCDCGAGMAYDPASEGDGVFKGPSKWECSDILRYRTFEPEKQAQVKAAMHTGALPFTFYEVKSENQSSANGQTTRPEAAT